MEPHPQRIVLTTEAKGRLRPLKQPKKLLMLVPELPFAAVVGAGIESVFAVPRFFSTTPTGKCCRRISRRAWGSLPSRRIWPLPKRLALRGQTLPRRLPWPRLRAPGIRLLLSRADAVPTCRRRRLGMASRPPSTPLDVSGTRLLNMPPPILRVLSVLVPCPLPLLLLLLLVHRLGRHKPAPLLRARRCALRCRLDCKRQGRHHHLAVRGSRPSRLEGRSRPRLLPLVASHPYMSLTVLPHLCRDRPVRMRPGGTGMNRQHLVRSLRPMLRHSGRW